MVKKKPGVAHTAGGKPAEEAEVERTSPAHGSAPTGERSGPEASEPLEAAAQRSGPGAAPADEVATRLEEEAAQWKDRCLRAAAELELLREVAADPAEAPLPRPA